MKKLQNNNKKLLTLGVVSLLIVAGIITFALTRSSINSDSNSDNTSKVNYDPPTKQEQAAGDLQKQQTIQQQELDANPVTDTLATVFISDASYYSADNLVEVRGYVSNIIEDGGRCTATFVQGSQTVTKATTAFKDATTTQCSAIDIPRSEFPNAGTWDLSLTYTSTSARGEQKTSIKL